MEKKELPVDGCAAAWTGRVGVSMNAEEEDPILEASYALIILQDNKTRECREETLYCFGQRDV